MARTPERWEVEDDAFWESTGKSIANRNLWISIPNLLCGFSVWLYWGMIIKNMQQLHFANAELLNFTFRNDGQPYDDAGYRALLFTLPAVAGLAGATLRIPNAYLIPKVFTIQIKAGTPERALYGFAAYYASCLAVNWWFYARKNAEIKC